MWAARSTQILYEVIGIALNGDCSLSVDKMFHVDAFLFVDVTTVLFSAAYKIHVFTLLQLIEAFLLDSVWQLNSLFIYLLSTTKASRSKILKNVLEQPICVLGQHSFVLVYPVLNTSAMYTFIDQHADSLLVSIGTMIFRQCLTFFRVSALTWSCHRH